MTLFPTCAVVTIRAPRVSTIPRVDGVTKDKTMVSDHVMREESLVLFNVSPWWLGHVVFHGRGLRVIRVVIAGKSGTLPRVHFVSAMVIVCAMRPVQVCVNNPVVTIPRVTIVK